MNHNTYEKLHPKIVETLIRGIRIPIAQYELEFYSNVRYGEGEYIFRKIRETIKNEVIKDWRRVLGSDKE